MAEVKINYNCGCGFKTTDQEEAIKHAEEVHHSLAVLGSIIVPRLEKVRKDGYGRDS